MPPNINRNNRLHLLSCNSNHALSTSRRFIVGGRITTLEGIFDRVRKFHMKMQFLLCGRSTMKRSLKLYGVLI